MAYEWRGKVIEGARGDQGATGDTGEKGPMGSATKQTALHIGSVPIKTGNIYFYKDMYSNDIVATGSISVLSTEGFVTSAPQSKMIVLSISLPACEAPAEENHGEGTIFYGYVDQTIDLSDITFSNVYRISDDGAGACQLSIDSNQVEKRSYSSYKITALKLSQDEAHFSTFLY